MVAGLISNISILSIFDYVRETVRETPWGRHIVYCESLRAKVRVRGTPRVNLHARNSDEQDVDARNCSGREAACDSLRAKSYVRGTEACKNLNTRHCERFSVREMVWKSTWESKREHSIADLGRVRRLTLTSKECDMSLARFRANPSDLPVSVANRMVAFLRLDRIFLMRKAAKRMALKKKQKK